ncbi:MAG: phosphopyruvate hydratase, partial [Patescibacteria group bacterium]
MTEKIKTVTARPILDSRGDWTLEAEIILENGLGARASVPQGKSRGGGEAVDQPVAVGLEKIKTVIAPALLGRKVAAQTELDQRLLELDGTTNKAQLGVDAILAVSLAAARLGALVKNLPLWRYLRELFNEKVDPNKPPQLLINLLNGGQHSGGNLPFQEYLIIPQTKNLLSAVELGQKFYQALAKLLTERFGRGAIKLGDEGGFAPDLADDEAPFSLFAEVAERLNVSDQFTFGLDAAANNLSRDREKLSRFYQKVAARYPLQYLEDPFAETAPDAFRQLNQIIGSKTIIVGDDLTVTNPAKITDPQLAGAITGVIIKPNQIGTLTETFAAIRATRKNGWRVFVSHRSGETNDDFIADLAYAFGCFGLK